MIYLDDAINAVKAGSFSAATLFGRTSGGMAALEETVRLIKDLPAAEPEIIRCKDCKYWRDDHTCREHSLVSPMTANEFCSRAERREE